MNPVPTLDLFRSLDRTGGQFPDGSRDVPDLTGRHADMRAVRHRLEIAFNVELKCESGDMIQDASFFALLILPPAVLLHPLPPKHVRTVKFSNFGRLAAIDAERDVKAEAVETIASVLVAEEFCWVPASLHQLRYDGVCTDAAGPIKTWYDRFFGWGYPERQ